METLLLAIFIRTRGATCRPSNLVVWQMNRVRFVIFISCLSVGLSVCLSVCLFVCLGNLCDVKPAFFHNQSRLGVIS